MDYDARNNVPMRGRQVSWNNGAGAGSPDQADYRYGKTATLAAAAAGGANTDLLW